MTKADLIEELAKVSNLTKKESETIVNTLFDTITGALATGDKVELRGFGSFRIRRRRARRGRNPKSGTRLNVPPKRVPFFKVGKELRRQRCSGTALEGPNDGTSPDPRSRARMNVSRHKKGHNPQNWEPIRIGGRGDLQSPTLLNLTFQVDLIQSG